MPQVGDALLQLRGDMRVLAARRALGIDTVAEAQDIASRLLDAEIYDDAILCVFDGEASGDRIDDMLQSQSFSPMEREQAIWFLLRHHAQALVDGSLAPHEAVSRMIQDVYWPADLHGRAKTFVGDSHGFEVIYGLYHNDHMSADEAGRAMRDAVGDWLAKYAERAPRHE